MELVAEQKRTVAQEEIISTVKEVFESELKTRLNVIKVNAPLYVSKKSGLNDNLNGVERPVSFDIAGETYEIVHSLAKWKRWYLGQLGMEVGKGLVTDMIAIRKDEVLTEIHSHLVDQWDWEKVIKKEERTLETLISHGTAVYQAVLATIKKVAEKEGIVHDLPQEIKVIHSEDVLQLYPELTPKEREHAITKEFGAVLLIGIGGKLSDGKEHDLRAPDYDDWTTKDEKGRPGLNADILVWDSVREKSLELSSMGVRVDEETLLLQLKESGCEDRCPLPFHQQLINGELPYTIGGGIGKSRVAMFVTKCGDIKEVQAVGM